MNSFLKKALLFLLLCTSLTVVIMLVYAAIYKVSFKDIPAPALSDSYSLNEKIEFLRSANEQQHVLAIGSSIALNNLSSDVIAKNIRPKSFLNVASWSMNMQDNFYLLKALNGKYHPDTILLASSISEFEMPSKVVDYEVVKEYLNAGSFGAKLRYITNFNLRYYMDNTKFKKSVIEKMNQYECLVFDKYGGVNIDDTNFEIDRNRWELSFDTSKINMSHYDYLDSIAVYCKLRNIKILFFQSPFRKGVYDQFGTNQLRRLKEHTSRIESILRNSNHVFIDSDKIGWDDSLFIDSEHLSAKGAAAFTEYCFEQLDSLKR